jgi:crotonobetainyl-CoA:carnitine CoA-transferase CaiB-like acyl-CoA transferase
MSALAGVRVLDLADESAIFASRVLADLGADVIRVEPPDGGRVRALAPFLRDEPGMERSLVHLAHDAGKRSLALDWRAPAGAPLLRRLVATADVVVETEPPGSLAARGLGHDDLAALRPGLVHVSVTPFGQRGPWSARKTSDLVAAAAGGLLWVSGAPEDPPTQMGADASFKLASLVALAGVMIALRGRAANGGRGVWLDVSIQQAVAMACVQTSNPNHWLWNRHVPKRPGLSGALECADGRFATLNVMADGFPAFLRWARELGLASELSDADWESVRGQRGGRGLLRGLAKSLPRADFLREAWARGLHALPIQSFEDLARCEHFAATGQFREVAHEPLGASLGFPRSALEAVSGTCLRGRAPLLGEHDDAIFAELGLAPDERARLARAGVIRR